MNGLITEELTGIIKKKRFIILTAAAFIGLLVVTVITKTKYWNDLTYFFAVQKYISFVFTPAAGIALILSVYRKKYTGSSILQVEDHGAKRHAGVISRFISGTAVLVSYYVVLAVLVIFFSLVFGAHNNVDQIRALLLRIATDCTASVAAYSVSLFWLYLTAFPVVPILIHGVTMIGIPLFFDYSGLYDNPLYRIGGFIIPKLTGDIAYKDLIFVNPRLLIAGAFLLQIIVPFLFSMLVFKLKKLKIKRGEDKNDPDK